MVVIEPVDAGCFFEYGVFPSLHGLATIAQLEQGLHG
jgi:hypothetical protein